MIAAIVFSRDRAMQLDLLLSSLKRNAPGVFDPVHVIWRATGPEFHGGYVVCERDHPDVFFVPENDLAAQVRYLLHAADFATFLTDDDVFYRSLKRLPLALPYEGHTLCFSLRLGLNTTYCYPLASDQPVPEHARYGDVIVWDWTMAGGDFAYPGSLDGHIFRGSVLRAIVDRAVFQSPNELEDVLVQGVSMTGKPRMASYAESRLVGIPANRVNTTHPNRHGERHAYDAADLNRRYLAGERIVFDALDFSGIRGAHQEIELKFA